MSGDESRRADDDSTSDRNYLERAVEITVRLGVLLLIVAWCYQLVRPFITPFAWGVIIAVASYHGYSRLVALTRGRTGLAAAGFVLLSLLVVSAPVVLMSGSMVEGVHALSARASKGRLTVPPPPASVEQWPVIGGPVHRYWTLASQNLNAALTEVRPQLRALGTWLVSGLAGTGFAFLEFVLAIFIAAFLLVHASACGSAAHAFGMRLAGPRGDQFISLAEETIRGVTRGILGVAVIQSALAGLGFLVVGIPGAGLWAFLCLLLSVVQVGPTLVLLPTVVYVFSTAATVPAVVYAVWCVVVGLSDNVLKPVLLGHGARVPMLVLFVGAIGGFLSEGIVGLFLGSVVLAIGYELLIAWLEPTEP